MFLLVSTFSGQTGHAQEIQHYTCGMHPSVKVSVENYEKGDTKCPICHMPLTAVRSAAPSSKADEPVDEATISRVQIALDELKRAGVETEEVKPRHLYKELRTVGTVAYDPQLAVAQEEYLSAIESLHKAQNGSNQDIIGRAQKLVEAAKRKLLLKGLSAQQIEEIAGQRKIQRNLILPEETMWIYGNVYESEIDLVKKGSRVLVTAVSLPGKEFEGEIVAIDPVIDRDTRSLRFRALVENPDMLLRPDMYVDVRTMTHYEDADGNHVHLAIPKLALLDTGRRKIVWVDKGNGAFEGRKVGVGPLMAEMVDGQRREYYPVLSGLKEGEAVVTKGNFLIDSQSQITGVAATGYGGALESPEQKGSPAGHQH